MAKIEDYAGNAGWLPPGASGGANKAQFQPAPGPDWTDIDTYRDVPERKNVAGLTVQQAAEELMRRYPRRGPDPDDFRETDERIAFLQQQVNALSSAEEYYRKMAQTNCEIAAMCTPSRADFLNQPRYLTRWQLWAFVSAPVVIAVLGIVAGYVIGR